MRGRYTIRDRPRSARNRGLLRTSIDAPKTRSRSSTTQKSRMILARRTFMPSSKRASDSLADSITSSRVTESLLSDRSLKAVKIDSAVAVCPSDGKVKSFCAESAQTGSNLPCGQSAGWRRHFRPRKAWLPRFRRRSTRRTPRRESSTV